MNIDDGPLEFPSAMPAPGTDVTGISGSLIQQVIDASRQSPRRRIIMPFHKSSDDRLQRMLNAIQPGSYIRPHRHVNPPKSESIVVLKGIICFVEFSESGDIGSVMVAGSALPLLGIDIDATVYHTYFALEPDTVLFEVKPGPYDEGSDKQFAPWAPAEGSVGCREFAANIEELTKQSWSQELI